MDALHDGLEVNPFTTQRHGCILDYPSESVEVAGLGYADDTNILTNSLPNLFIQNEWVQYFMRYNHLRLNPHKCELVGRGADGAPVTQAALDAHHITIDGVPIPLLPHDRSIRYLGVHSCFNGSWKEQQNKALAVIAKFSRLALKFHLSIRETVYMFNVFLTSRLELALHYVHGPGTSAWIKSCDRLMAGCIKHLAQSPLRLSHTALAAVMHFVLPSRLERSIKVSELFIRLNSSDSRWGRLGRAVFRTQLPASVDSTTPLSQPNRGTRNTRAAYLAVVKLRWSLHLSELRSAVGRRRHLFDMNMIYGTPLPDQCSSSAAVELTSGITQVAHDCWVGWGATEPRVDDAVHVYTDGSHDPWTATSSWSVVVGDRWLNENHDSVPSECLLQLPHIGGATLLGAAITCTQGVYPAELQAIVRTLAMLPLTSTVHIHSDSEASIASIQSFRRELNERTRMRSAARTILQLIDVLANRRQSAGGDMIMSHVRAHTDNNDIHSIGNRIADFQANRARNSLLHSIPRGLEQLPLASCEQYLHIKHADGRVVIDDLRRSSRTTTRAQDLEYWSKKNDHHGTFACDGTIELGRVVLKEGSEAQQKTLVHVATNSMHFHWHPPNDPGATLQQVRCDCQVALSLDHLATCFTPLCVVYRLELQKAILAELARCDDTQNWLRANRGGDLFRLFLRLFPLSVIATAEEVALHPSRCLIGAYTHRECTSAMKTLGINDREEGRATLTQLRLISLDRIDRLYTRLKAATP